MVDCDYPQFSIEKMRYRDVELMNTNQALYDLAEMQFSRLNKPTYPILSSLPDDAIDVVKEYLSQSEDVVDFVFFDLPGTFNSEGVLATLSSVDYIFTPISADKISL